MSYNVSVITLLHNEKEFIPLIKYNYQNLNNFDSLELVVIDDGKEDLSALFQDVKNCTYIHLTQDDIQKFMDQIIEGYKQPNKTGLLYQKKLNRLPNGFKRDYGCGMSNNPYIFHMNMDCIYHKKSIERKYNFLKKTGGECIYCDQTLCYDIYNHDLYKTESQYKIYESTLFHTREFWTRKGFQWSDIEYEGKYFHYNNGVDRKLDNYYDTIQILSIHNLNEYQPIKITLDNITIDIPELVSSIQIQVHPFIEILNDLYEGNVDLLGINSEFIENLHDERFNTYTIADKWKQTKLAKQVKDIKESFNVLLFGSKHPAWDLFNHIPFDIIFLETQKNLDQMSTILSTCKKYEYIQIKGIYIRKDFLE